MALQILVVNEVEVENKKIVPDARIWYDACVRYKSISCRSRIVPIQTGKKGKQKKRNFGVTSFVDGQASPLVEQAVPVSVLGHHLPNIVGVHLQNSQPAGGSHPYLMFLWSHQIQPHVSHLEEPSNGFPLL